MMITVATTINNTAYLVNDTHVIVWSTNEMLEEKREKNKLLNIG